MSSAAQIAANQKNSQLSTGPASEAGKANSSLNAVTSGLTGRTVLLPAEDAAEYQCHLAAFVEEFAPVGLRECELVQSISDTWWRLRRIPSLESALFAKGRIEFAALFEEHELAARPHLIDAHTFITYEKQIRNLQLQEARLVRRREKETTELRKLQEQRNEKQNGFEFSDVDQTASLRPVGNRPVQELKSYTENSSITSPCTPTGSSGSLWPSSSDRLSGSRSAA